MEDKERHINQKPDEKYPAPGVPVNDAWAQIKDMLDTELPVVGSEPEKISFLAKSWKLLSALVILAGLLLFVFHKTSKNNLTEIITSQSETVRTDELKSSQKTNTDQGYAQVTSDSNSAITARTERESSKRGQQADVKENSSITILDKSQPTDIAGNNNLLKENNRVNLGSTTGEEISKNNRASITFKRNRIVTNKRNSYQNTDYKTVNSTNHFKNIKDLSQKPDGVIAGKLEKIETNNISHVNFVSGKNLYFATNILKNTFKSIEISIPPNAQIDTKSTSPKNQNSSQILKNTHFGVQWNATIPTSGYRDYFRGTSGRNQYYTPFIPGLWVSKEFNSGNELLLKLSAYQQYFGTNKEVNSSFVYLTDSVNISRSTALVKVVGINAAIQYNFIISDQWSLGVGAQSFLQQKALLRTRSEHHIIDSLSIPRVLSIADSLSGITHSSDQWKYLSHYHVAGNAEVIYKWNRFQLGLGVIVPFKSITNTSYGRLRPVSGQVSFRWRIK